MIETEAKTFTVENPLDLLTPLRFDIPSKTLYARHRDKGVSRVWITADQVCGHSAHSISLP